MGTEARRPLYVHLYDQKEYDRMKRKLFAFSMTLALLMSMLTVASVGAHTVQVENSAGLAASRTDWFGVQPGTAGLGAVQRNSAQQGEFIFNDASKDQRLIASATKDITRAVDIDWFGVTADATNIYFLTKVDNYNGIQQSPAINLAVTVDTNHTANVGTLVLPTVSTAFTQTVSVPSDAAWEYAVSAQFKPGAAGTRAVNANKLVIYTNATTSSNCGASCKGQLVSAATSKGSFVELAIPWASIGGKPTGSNFLRFTVATSFNNEALPTASDNYKSPILDTLGVVKSNTDIIDGQLDPTSAVDVHFDTNVPAGGAASYEPYAPLLITEFQANPVGKDDPGAGSNSDSEWIEVYNPNSFAIGLNDYKIGNAATRGSSSQGMLRMPNTSLEAKGVRIFARSKSKFVAAHPTVDASKVIDWSGLTKYNTWATGILDLENISGSAIEEQILILDAKDGIIDMVTYGNPTNRTPGVIPIVTTDIPEVTSYERCPAGLDTNGGFIDGGVNDPPSSTDFVYHGTFGEQTPGVLCVGRPGLDLSIVKTGPEVATVGTDVTFTLTYNNIGTASELGGVQSTITDTLPVGMTFKSSTVVPTSQSGQVVVWKVTPPAVGGSPTTIDLVATVDAGAPQNTALVNRAVISTPNESTDAVIQGNNQSEWTVSTLGPALLDVSFDGLTAAPPGRQFVFTLNYANNGQSPAAGVTVSLDIPAGVTIQSISSGSATPTFSTPVSGPTTVTWTVSQLEAISAGGITITGQVGAGVASGTSLPFSATISSTDVGVAPKTVGASLKAEFLRLYIPIARK